MGEPRPDISIEDGYWTQGVSNPTLASIQLLPLLVILHIIYGKCLFQMIILQLNEEYLTSLKICIRRLIRMRIFINMNEKLLRIILWQASREEGKFGDNRKHIACAPNWEPRTVQQHCQKFLMWVLVIKLVKYHLYLFCNCNCNLDSRTALCVHEIWLAIKL